MDVDCAQAGRFQRGARKNHSVGGNNEHIHTSASKSFDCAGHLPALRLSYGQLVVEREALYGAGCVSQSATGRPVGLGEHQPDFMPGTVEGRERPFSKGRRPGKS